MILNEFQIKQLCYNAGFRGTALNYAVEIARCESDFNTNAHNTSGEDSRGLFQINVSESANPQYKKYDLFNPQINCNIAFEMFRDNNNTFERWTCARNLNLENPETSNNTIAIISLAIISAIVLYLT